MRVKPFLFAVGKASGLAYLAEALVRWTTGGRMAVLLFHRVTDEIPEDGLTVSTARFHRICRLLRDRFTVVSLAGVFDSVRLGMPLPHRTVAITFDDCYRDNLDAARMLAEFNLPACFFIPTAFVGTDARFPWDRDLKPLANLTWDDVRTMSRLGFEIGSHTVTHPDMGRITREEARRELAESKTVLEDQLEREVRWFAYPFGGQDNFRPEWLPLLREAGYEGCVSGYGGFLCPDPAAEMLPRIAVPSFQDERHLELYLSGAFHWYYALKGGAPPVAVSEWAALVEGAAPGHPGHPARV